MKLNVSKRKDTMLLVSTSKPRQCFKVGNHVQLFNSIANKLDPKWVDGWKVIQTFQDQPIVKIQHPNKGTKTVHVNKVQLYHHVSPVSHPNDSDINYY